MHITIVYSLITVFLQHDILEYKHTIFDDIANTNMIKNVLRPRKKALTLFLRLSFSQRLYVNPTLHHSRTTNELDHRNIVSFCQWQWLQSWSSHLTVSISISYQCLLIIFRDNMRQETHTRWLLDHKYSHSVLSWVTLTVLETRDT